MSLQDLQEKFEALEAQCALLSVTYNKAETERLTLLEALSDVLGVLTKGPGDDNARIVQAAKIARAAVAKSLEGGS